MTKGWGIIALVVAGLYWLQAVLIPLALAVLLTFLLSSVVSTRLQAAGANSGRSAEEVTAAQRPPSAAVPMSPLQRTPQARAGTNRATGPDRRLSAGA